MAHSPSKYYRANAVVLRTWKLGEADRILSLLTDTRGHVRAVAKGVRRTKSRFGSRLEPTTCVSLQLYEGRGDLDTVTQAETIERYLSLREDLDRYARASAMLEAVDQMSRDSHDVAHLYPMLVRALRTLDSSGSAMVVPGFFLKLLASEGFAPIVDGCVECGVDEDLVAIDAESGGLLCSTHRRGRALMASTVEGIGDVLGGRLGQALAIDDQATVHEIEIVATELMEHHLERRIRSTRVVD